MILLSICIRTLIVNAVNGTPTYKNAIRYSRGVGNVCYWISRSASGYTDWIQNSAQLWYYNGYSNPIYIQQFSTNYATHMDIYASTLSDTNTNGYTQIFDSNGNILSFSSTTFFFANIVVNSSGSGLSQATVVHEMGHAFGLDHYGSNSYSIMYPTSSDCKVTTPQQCDVQTINVLY